MEELPLYIGIMFCLTTLLALTLFLRAAHYSKIAIVVMVCWLALQALIGLTGFYTVTNTLPPRFLLLVLPPLFMVILLFGTKKGRVFIDQLDVKVLTLLHIIRIPVEVTLLLLYIFKLIPKEMTFEGWNFDIIAGISAPLIYYFRFLRNAINKKAMLIWNIVCLILLVNIVTIAVLSAPFSFQQFAFEQPNIAVLHFPFIWLPGFIVPIVLFSHLVAIRKLIRS